jgi:ERCC4-type nuclease
VEPLRKLGVVVEETILPAGDAEIVGIGPSGRPVLVGCEYKSIEDVAACVRNGRFADQLRKMRDSFEVSWLLIEGRLRGDRKGIAVKRGEKWFTLPGLITYQEIVSWTMTMCQRGGVLLWRTESKLESAAWLRSLELWWTAKDWEEHRAHMDWYTPPIESNPFEGRPGLARRWANELPGVGDGKSRLISARFRSGRALANASVEELTQVEGVGKKLANAIVKAVKEEK